MLQICQDFQDEADELHVTLKALDAELWSKPTLFMDWTPRDVVAHLHYFDLEP